jgi:hypothetical protein
VFCPLVCGSLGALFLLQWFVEFHNYEAFHRSNLSLLPSQASLHDNGPGINYVSLCIYTHTVDLAAGSTGV